MPIDTPSMAKNKIRRSLLAILDPHPSDSEVEVLWRYFESRCAYCGNAIARESRNGHLDHVIASTLGGGNGIHNCVLSCGRCNGDEKREEDWRTFLLRKAESVQVAAVRAGRIEGWLFRAAAARLSPEAEQQAQAIIAAAIAQYAEAVSQVRALRHVGAKPFVEAAGRDGPPLDSNGAAAAPCPAPKRTRPAPLGDTSCR